MTVFHGRAFPCYGKGVFGKIIILRILQDDQSRRPEMKRTLGPYSNLRLDGESFVGAGL
jgi:hypothetical protein